MTLGHAGSLKVRVLFVVATAAITLTTAGVSAQEVDLQTVLLPDRVCSLTRDVMVGIDGVEPFEMIETVRPISRDGGMHWRATHYPLRIVEYAREGAVSFDVTDVDQATLRPIESEARNGPEPVRFDYRGPAARQIGPKGEILDTTVLGDRVPLPWYPGSTILTQAIPWRDGFRAFGYIVDNYSGRGEARLRRLEVSVVGRETIDVKGVVTPSYRVVWRAKDGFELHERVSIAQPHQVVETDYYPVAGGKPFRSRLKAKADGTDCRA